MSDAEFRTITVDYTAEFARGLHKSSPNAGFAFLSGQGADPKGKSRIAFARYKGEAENALLAAGFHAVYIFRPAYIYPVEPRRSPTSATGCCARSIPYFGCPSQVIRADDLARVMVDVAVCRTKERRASAFENNDIRAMAKWIQHLTK